MKLNRFIQAITITCVTAGIAFGAVWRVNNNEGTSPDFVTLQEAHDSADYGDTLYVEGSTTGYGDAVITKQLAIFGPGFFLNDNVDTQANTSSASAGVLTCNNGSQGSEISGMTLANANINTDEIIFRRNRVVNTATFSPSTVKVTDSQNVLVSQNHIYHYPNHNTTYFGVEVNGSSFITVQNNYIHGRYAALKFSDNASCVFKNNVIVEGIDGNGQQLINNILTSGTYTGTNDLLNNVGNSDQFGTEDGNQSDVPMATVFTGAGSPDGQWQLSFNSPAAEAGFGGEDCGMFGGPTPYILSGMPNIPAIYQFVAPTVVAPSASLPVHIKAKSHSEE